MLVPLLLLCCAISTGSETIPIQLEHARTEAQHTLGLSGRTDLSSNEGMLFHFNPPKQVTIWMKGVLIDLDVAFIDGQGVIREIHTLKAHPDIQDPAFFRRQAVTSPFNAAFVLEMRANWFAENRVTVGAQLIK